MLEPLELAVEVGAAALETDAGELYDDGAAVEVLAAMESVVAEAQALLPDAPQPYDCDTPAGGLYTAVTADVAADTVLAASVELLSPHVPNADWHPVPQY